MRLYKLKFNTDLLSDAHEKLVSFRAKAQYLQVTL